MHVVSPVYCGIDVHQAQLTVCLLRVDTEGQVVKEVREFETTYPALLPLLDWLIEHHCPVVALESTGVYWKPVSNLLEGSVMVLVVHAAHGKNVPGRKTDKADACWLATLMRYGLLQASVLPSAGHRDVRDVTRDRTTLVQERVREVHRVQGV